MTRATWMLMPVLILPFFAPIRLARRFRIIELILRGAARRPYFSVSCLGFVTFCVGAFIAHFGQWPVPLIHDEFSYLLASDTFAHGRLTNPPHEMWRHFESPHILLQPTYASKYPPAQGLFLAFGQAVFGMPIVGVWLSNAFAAMATVWMLRGWLPFRWAFLGGFLLGAHPAIILWGQSYWGGSIAVLGGCLVVGAWPRVAVGKSWGAALLGAVGIALLANSRPYEGLVLTAAIGCCQLFSWLRTRVTGIGAIFKNVLLPAAAVLIPTACGMAYLNYRVTGHVDRLPYQEHARQYSVAPPLLWQAAKEEPEYGHEELQKLYAEWEADQYRGQQSFMGFLAACQAKIAFYFSEAFATPLLLLALLGVPWVLRSRGLLPVFLVLFVFLLALLSESYVQAHYAAPAAGLVNLLCIQGLRYIRCLRRPRSFVGRNIFRLAFVLSLATTAIYVGEYEQALANNRSIIQRKEIEKRIRATQGNHLVIVTYGKHHDIHDEWVYNGADPDRSRIVWAHDLGAKANDELKWYFRNRHIWQVVVGAVPGGTRLVELGSGKQ